MKGFSLPFDKQCDLAGLPKPVAELAFAKGLGRRWRFDWAWVDQGVAVEVEGGAFIAGRHTRGAGFLKDMEKYNTAAILGWRILRVTPKQIENGEALNLVDRIIRGKAA